MDCERNPFSDAEVRRVHTLFDPIEDFETIRRELSLFSAQLGRKPQLVAATKMDAAVDLDTIDRLERHVKALGLPFLRISAVAKSGSSATTCLM